MRKKSNKEIKTSSSAKNVILYLNTEVDNRRPIIERGIVVTWLIRLLTSSTLQTISIIILSIIIIIIVINYYLFYQFLLLLLLVSINWRRKVPVCGVKVKGEQLWRHTVVTSDDVMM